MVPASRLLWAGRRRAFGYKEVGGPCQRPLLPVWAMRLRKTWRCGGSTPENLPTRWIVEWQWLEQDLNIEPFIFYFFPSFHFNCTQGRSACSGNHPPKSQKVFFWAGPGRKCPVKQYLWFAWMYQFSKHNYHYQECLGGNGWTEWIMKWSIQWRSGSSFTIVSPYLI